MKVSDILNELEAEVRCGETSLDRDISWCYCSDLLSDVMANAQKDSIWITLQTHPNIVAVASLLGLSAILISRGAEPDPETLNKAAQENIPVLTTKLPTFEAAGRLFMLLNQQSS
ncbi:MAG: serine kinase [Firmicutes bacterium HGW-Firmicutes-14]|nr:MAG: serine kinase [Firmicutes bacterium HGW-Firmicutes-14]